jgi:hypothetical protein
VDIGVAGFANHEGLASPSCHDLRPFGLWLFELVEVGELANLVHAHLLWFSADLALSREEPVDQLFAAGFARRGTRSVKIAVRCRLSGMPPNVATNGCFPSPRSTTACMHARGPCGVSIVAAYLRATFVTVESCLRASVLSSEVSVTQRSRSSR